MISRLDIEERAREWGLREDVVEKDYVLGWLLWGIGTDPVLSTRWAFKGGTCLKKCFLETYRFSEDLDFTVLPSGPSSAEQIRPLLERVLKRVGEESGIDFSRQALFLRTRPSGHDDVEGRVYYVGPRATPSPASVKLDISSHEVVVRPTTQRAISHSYPDPLPAPATVCCYSFEEVFAEKLRALGQRGRPRDLYDVVNLFRRSDFETDAIALREILAEKCRFRNIAVPTAASFVTPEGRAEMAASWEAMLGHQLLALPPLEDFWNEMLAVFRWLESGPPIEPKVPVAPLPVRAAKEPIDESWRIPSTISTWGQRVPIEAIRFAAANRLCVALGYDGSVRTIEPYSLRRTQAGHYLLFAVRTDSGEDRSYRVDRIERVEVTGRTFQPRYRVEFTSTGPLHAPPLERAPRVGALPRMLRRTPAAQFAIRCPYCRKTFRRTIPNLNLGAHKTPAGYPCAGSGQQGLPA